MKNFLPKLNIIIGGIVIYLSILFLAIGVDSPFLAIAGLVIAPALVIYLNKKRTIKPRKYYLSLFGS